MNEYLHEWGNSHAQDVYKLLYKKLTCLELSVVLTLIEIFAERFSAAGNFVSVYSPYFFFSKGNFHRVKIMPKEILLNEIFPE